MKYFPIYLDMENAAIMIMGSGEAAVQKTRLLLKTEAEIHIFAEDDAEFHPELRALSAAPQGKTDKARLFLHPRRALVQDLAGKKLLYVALEQDPPFASHVEDIIAAARAQNIPVNVIDQPDLCSFITPAIVDRAPVTVAIGTEGAAPILAREIKAHLEAWLPHNYGAIARLAAQLRPRILSAITDGVARRRLWQKLLRGPFRSAALKGNEDQARQIFAEELSLNMSAAHNANAHAKNKPGTVALIGCGPGDPDLLTLKAQQRMQDADVLVVDRLVNPAILDYARRDAQRIYVGKQAGNAKESTSQDEINAILRREALKGHNVARLKGGDPFIFGRAVEEMQTLQAAGIELEIIPGITAAQASAAAAQLPLTARGQGRKFSVVTGATAEGFDDKSWLPLLERGESFAIYMGVRTAPAIRARLLKAGIAPHTPLVIVEKASLNEERIVSAKLNDLAQAIEHCGILGPAIIFVGLSWQALGLAVPPGVEQFAAHNTAKLAAPEHINTQTLNTHNTHNTHNTQLLAELKQKAGIA